jgi:hypothetical protein
MFSGASVFDQNLSNWDVSGLVNAASMFHSIALSTSNYDALLIGWDSQTLQSNVTFDGGDSFYCLAETEREHMITSDNWTITDGGMNCTSSGTEIFLPMIVR